MIMELTLLINKLETLYMNWGYLLIFVGSFVETTPLGWTIPGGTMVAAGGFFAYSGSVSLVGVVMSGWLGILLVFLLSYYIGLRTGPGLARKFNQENKVKRAKVLLEKYGPTILTTSLLANLTRFWIAYVAGLQKYNPLKFIFYSALASLAWSSLLTTIGYLAGSSRDKLENGIAQLGIFSWLLLLIAGGFIYWLNKKEQSDALKEKL
jgi:membrane protein DedA with SNARE-associated domain